MFCIIYERRRGSGHRGTAGLLLLSSSLLYIHAVVQRRRRGEEEGLRDKAANQNDADALLKGIVVVAAGWDGGDMLLASPILIQSTGSSN